MKFKSGIKPIILPFFLLILIQFACTDNTTSQITKKANGAGLFEFKSTFNRSGLNFSHVAKVWYKDSLTIQEDIHINTSTDTANITKTSFILLGYKFVDPVKTVIYNYQSFFDTAQVKDKGVLKYRVRDAVFSYYRKDSTNTMENPRNLKDTIIENITYKRVQFNMPGTTPGSYHVGHWTCDGRGILFSLEKRYSDSISCTMTKIMSYLPGQTDPYFKQEVIFLRDSLTPEELKVFDAWEGNVTKYPVK